MKQFERACRVGWTAIALALVLRIYTAGLPGKILAFLARPETAAFLIYLETGRDVRFSPSLEGFTPDFAESFPAAAILPEIPALPAFSGEEAVELYYAANKNPDISALLAKPLEWELCSEEPTVLILHTHSTESYTRQGEDYRETSAWRTVDDGYNMLSIGQRVAELLQEAGISVMRDTALHDYPSYNGSYTRARKSIRAFLEEHPTIRLILDLHRDASGEGRNQMRPVTKVAGKSCAQLMLVLGTNMDTWQDNLSLALKLQAQLEKLAPGITRPLQLRPQRFNQDLCPGALLIEVGAAGNTHSEALLAADYLAQTLIFLAKGTQEAP